MIENEINIPEISDEESLSRKMIEFNFKRGAFLSQCDWTQLPDSPLTNLQKAAWSTYRQALRDLPDQPGFDPANVTWPSKP